MKKIGISYNENNAVTRQKNIEPFIGNLNTKGLFTHDWTISINAQDRIIKWIISSLSIGQFKDFTEQILSMHRKNLSVSGTSHGCDQFENFLLQWQKEVLAANKISEVGRNLTEQPQNRINEEILPKMDKELYLQRLKASLERNKTTRKEAIIKSRKMPKEKRKILDAMIETMGRE